MVQERASQGAKLRPITIVGLGELLPGKDVFKLRGHVTHMEYRVGENPPEWDSIPDDESGHEQNCAGVYSRTFAYQLKILLMTDWWEG